MEEIAQRIVEDLEPPAGYSEGSIEQLRETALVMLESMDEDTVEECMRDIFRVVSSEYGE